MPKLFEGIKEIIALLEKHDGPFFLGQDISIADLGVGPFVQRLFATGRAGLIPAGVYDKLTSDPEFKVLADYEKTLTSRESFKVSRRTCQRLIFRTAVVRLLMLPCCPAENV